MKRSPADGAIQRPIMLIRETPRHGTSARGPASRWLSTTKPEKSYMSVRQDTDTEAVVYVRLLDEGTDVWRPARATALPDGTAKRQLAGIECDNAERPPTLATRLKVEQRRLSIAARSISKSRHQNSR